MIKRHVKHAYTEFTWVAEDTLVMTWRNLIRYRRLPQLVIFSTIEPVIFVLLFTYVFGGAINIGGLDYIDYLVPGIVVVVVIFGANNTGVGLADDLSRGLVDRFRSLPMARPALLAGRTLADTVRNVFVLLLTLGVGLAIGFDFHGSIDGIAAGAVIALLFGFAFCWFAALIGMAVKDPETAQVAGFVWVLPLVFASSMFVAIETMPGWLQAFAKFNPVTSAVDTVRALWLGTAPGSALWKCIAWTGGIIAVCAPISVYRYRHVH